MAVCRPGEPIESKLKEKNWAVSLAIALKQGDGDAFVDLYDSPTCSKWDDKKISSVKEQARELSEQSIEYLQTFQAQLQFLQGHHKSSQSKLSGSQEKSGDTSEVDLSNSSEMKSTQRICMADVNQNHLCQDVSEESSINPNESLISNLGPDNSNKMNLKQSNQQKKDVNFDGRFGESFLVPSYNDPGSGRIKQEQTDGCITRPNQNEPSWSKQLGFIRGSSHSIYESKDFYFEESEDSKMSSLINENESIKFTDPPHHPNDLLKKSAKLVSKPQYSKNCPEAEVITQNGYDEMTEIRFSVEKGNHRVTSSRKKNARKIQRELKDAEEEKGDVVMETHINATERNESKPLGLDQKTYGTMDVHGQTKAVTVLVDNSNGNLSANSKPEEEQIKKKKRKKKKKKDKEPICGNADSTTEGEESRPTVVSTKYAILKTPTKLSNSPDSSSDKDNHSGEGDHVEKYSNKEQHVFSNNRKVEKAPKSAKKNKDKNSVSVNSKKISGKAGGDNRFNDVSTEGNSVPTEEIQLPSDEKERETSSETNFKGDDKPLFSENRLVQGTIPTTFCIDGPQEKEVRTAMSDPGENDEDDGQFNTVQYRKSKRRAKKTDQMVGKEYHKYDLARSDVRLPMETDINIRKSRSVPQDMSNLSGSRQRGRAVSEVEEPFSTTTTTTTTSSRRDSIESESSDMGKFQNQENSYASKLKAMPSQTRHKKGNQGKTFEKPSFDTSNFSQGVDKSLEDKSIGALKKINLANGTQDSRIASTSIAESLDLETSRSPRQEIILESKTESLNAAVPCKNQRFESQSVQYLDLHSPSSSYASRLKQNLKTSIENQPSIVTPKLCKTSNGEKDKKQITSDACEDNPSVKSTSTLPSAVNESIYQENLVNCDLQNLNSYQEGTEGIIKLDVGFEISHEKAANPHLHDILPETNGVTTNLSASHASEPILQLAQSKGVEKNKYVQIYDDNIFPFISSPIKREDIRFGGIYVFEENGNIVVVDDNPVKDGQEVHGENFDDRHPVSKNAVSLQDIRFSPLEKSGDLLTISLPKRNIAFDVDGLHAKTSRFNLSAVAEMFSKDWQMTLEQSTQCPGTVHFCD